MKKLLLGSASLCLFALAIVLIQISCQKTIAQVDSPGLSKKLLLYHTTKYETKQYYLNDDTSRTRNVVTENYARNTYFVSDWDGNNERTIPITIPNGMYSGEYVALSNDATRLFFSLYEIAAPPTKERNSELTYYIYSCNIDGSDVKRIKAGLTLDDVH